MMIARFDMSILKIKMFGSFSAQLGERPLPTFGSNKAQALLIYLLIENDKPHQRETLMTLLWPEATLKAAQVNLRQTLARLRKAIPESGGHPLLLSDRKTISLNPEATYEVDALQFIELLKREQTLENLETAVNLYRGEFLQDFYLPDCNEFEAWASNQRAFFYRKIQQVLQELIALHLEGKDYESAETAVHHQLSLDNLQESVHRQLIEVLVKNGRRQDALTHFEHLQQLLQEELALDPEPETIQLVEAIRKGELTSEPNLRSSKREPHNLPQRLTSFIGREKEMDVVVDLLSENRLVTLIAVGGIGKTTLSIQVGHQLIDSYADGVWLVELAPVLDPALLPQAVAFALGLKESADHSISEVLNNHLRNRNCLIILDNCEHLIDAARHFSESILQTCPEVKILASSREAFDIPVEDNLFCATTFIARTGRASSY